MGIGTAEPKTGYGGDAPFAGGSPPWHRGCWDAQVRRRQVEVGGRFDEAVLARDEVVAQCKQHLDDRHGAGCPTGVADHGLVR